MTYRVLHWAVVRVDLGIRGGMTPTVCFGLFPDGRVWFLSACCIVVMFSEMRHVLFALSINGIRYGRYQD